MLESLLSIWANILRQERATVRSSLMPFVIPRQGCRMTPKKLFLTLVCLPAAFLSPKKGPSKERILQSLDHFCSSSSYRKNISGGGRGCCSIAHPFFLGLGLVKGFPHENESLDAMVGLIWNSAVGLVLLVKGHSWASYKLLTSHCA